MAKEQNLLNFKVSAPGKVILHGEHSVVYGKPALAGAIGLRNFLKLTENSSTLLLFDFKTINKKYEVEVEELNKMLSLFKDQLSDNAFILEHVTQFTTKHIENSNCDQGFKAILCSLYLLCGILAGCNSFKIRNGFCIEIASEMRVGAGLGSSASFGVCLATAFLVLSRSITFEENISLISNDHKSLISEWAFNAEKIMHGTPSGVDNTVCTFGNIVKFSKGKPIVHIQPKSEINILLVDSNISRSTANLVSKVAETKKQFPTVIDHILNAMEETVEQAVPLYEQITPESLGKFEHLQKLFQINNDLLKGLGVSHVKLEQIFTIAHSNGFSSKITGAGGGGYAIILLPSNYRSLEAFKMLTKELDEQMFEFFETTVGGCGVEVHFSK